MKRTVVAIGIIALALANVPVGLTQSRIPDVATLGPQVGARVPDFALRDQTGRVQTLRSIMGPKGAILVFFRSADW